MGLQAEVPLCGIKLSNPDTALLQINSDDLLQLPQTPQVHLSVLILSAFILMSWNRNSWLGCPYFFGV